MFPKPAKQWLKALFNAHLQLKQTAQAKKVLDRLLRLDPEDADLWRISASLELERKHYRAAAAALEVAHRLKPAGPSDWRTLGDIYRAAKVPLKAVECYQSGLTGRKARRPKQLDTLARLYLQADDLKQALAAAQKAAEFASPRPSGRPWWARYFCGPKSMPRPLTPFERAARLAGRKGRPLQPHGRVLRLADGGFAQGRQSPGPGGQAGPAPKPLAKEAAQSLAAVQEHLRNKEQASRRGG